MSLHIMYDHQCSKCEAYYIPYEKGIVCPNCSAEENEVFDVVSRLVESANYQMSTTGMYEPLAWWIGSLGDHIALLVFKSLDKFYNQEEKDFMEIAEIYFNSTDWGSQQYLKNHIRDIANKVYLEIEGNKL